MAAAARMLVMPAWEPLIAASAAMLHDASLDKHSTSCHAADAANRPLNAPHTVFHGAQRVARSCASSGFAAQLADSAQSHGGME